MEKITKSEKKKYRIRKYTGDVVGDVWFEIERYKKFLWFEWWGTEYEMVAPECTWPLYFRDEKEAKEKIDELRNKYSSEIIE
jgi:hypothetical protein